MDEFTNPNVFARRLIDLYGGRDAAFKALHYQFRAIEERWNQDTVTIGRILRAHLFVEYYLTKYLQVQNPKLPDLDQVRLSFTQKVSMIGEAEKSVAYLVPGLKILNRVRNRVAHTYRTEITAEEKDLFLAIGMFQAMRNALAAPAVPSTDPIIVLEDFAKHAGLTLAPNPDQEKWTKAMKGT